MSTYYFLPTRNVFGEGAVNEVGDLMKSLNVYSAMIVTDKFLASSGMADRIVGILNNAGMNAVVFDGAEPNPTDKNVEAGVEFFTHHTCDSIISLGGGSSHDCAKGIALAAVGDQHHCRDCFGNYTFLHHHRHQPPCQDGHRRLARDAKGCHQRSGADEGHATFSDRCYRYGCLDPCH